MAELKHLNPAFLPAVPGFSWIVDDGETVHIAGQLAISSELTLAEEAFEAQCRLSFQNLKRCLEEVGCTERDLVEMTCYFVPDPANPTYESFQADVQTMMTVQNEVIPQAAPAGMIGRIAGLFFEAQRFEVSATARRTR